MTITPQPGEPAPFPINSLPSLPSPLPITIPLPGLPSTPSIHPPLIPLPTQAPKFRRLDLRRDRLARRLRAPRRDQNPDPEPQFREPGIGLQDPGQDGPRGRGE